VRRFFADTTPLRTRDFRRLWFAGIVTVIGGNLTIFAVPVQLYALTHGATAAAVGTTVAAAGGGGLVLVGVVVAALVVPAFVRYRVAEGDKV
jgi:hypothetical protein